ncbi:hypothetical protein C8J57DRAFT_1239730 [Mycena rebaudengoi]|nr:hypothetical protein C8J57DRAFT_1239730 [Mycena rebaudengoi]
MANYQTTVISATRPPPANRLSIASIASFSSVSSSSSAANAIVITATVITTTQTAPAPIPPPFTASLGSDERLPRPRHGAPPVRPAPDRKPHDGLGNKFRRAVGLESRAIDPALCKEW